MARVSFPLLTLLFSSVLLSMAGFDSIVIDVFEFFSGEDLGCSIGNLSLVGCANLIISTAAPAIVVAFALLSGNTLFTSFVFWMVFPFITFPYELFTSTIVPVEIKVLFGGFLALMLALSGISASRGET